MVVMLWRNGRGDLAMNTVTRKKIAVISKYAADNFSESDWYTLGQITGRLDLVTNHPRLLRSMSFGDDDYTYCAIEVLNQIFKEDEGLVEEAIEYFDIALWYQQKEPEKHKKLFLNSFTMSPDFWKEGYLKLFLSHLSSNKERMSHLKASFDQWGVYAFVAHEDIEPTREWRNEVEVALETMEVMVVLVEPGIKESDWCCQEVGYALGRKIEIVPLRAGLDPFGFFGKYQGIQVKGKTPSIVAEAVVSTLLKKPKYRAQLLQSIGKSFASLQSDLKTKNVKTLDSWSVATDDQLKSLLERISLSDYEKKQLKDIIGRTNAFQAPILLPEFDDDIPF